MQNYDKAYASIIYNIAVMSSNKAENQNFISSLMNEVSLSY